ncbi:hypothetical protein H4R18_003875, partial [Coemansia javaensis]
MDHRGVPAEYHTSDAFPITIDASAVVHGFDRWRKILPNHAALHGLAVWEVYRAHAETAIDGRTITADA